MEAGYRLLGLSGRAAVVTGASRGIGAATAAALARAGSAVALIDVDGDGVEQQAEQIRGAGATAVPLVADVTDAASVQRAIDEVRRTWGRLDILVNNAGILRDGRLEYVRDEDWTATMDVNLRGAMTCARAVVPLMREAGHGRILSAGSVVARRGNFGQTSYTASKAGIVGMTRSWARELGPLGITANAVAPGFIDTPMLASVPAKVVRRLLEHLPAGRLGRADEVAAVYVFLASDLASFINGAVVGVDGGLLL